jgi:hypothetical protein
MKSSLLHLCAVTLGAALNAAAAEPTNSIESVSRPEYWPWTLGIDGGSTGVGAFGAWRFADHFGARVGVDVAMVMRHNTGIAGTHYDADLRLLSEPLTLDIYPWKNHSWHLSIGAMFNQNQLAGSVSHSGVTVIDGEAFPTDRVGLVSARVEQQPVNPYASIGGTFFYFDCAHHWAFGGELGVAYTGDQRVSLGRSGGAADPAIDAAVERARHHLENHVDQYAWWPVVKLMVSYSF